MHLSGNAADLQADCRATPCDLANFGDGTVPEGWAKVICCGWLGEVRKMFSGFAQYSSTTKTENVCKSH